MISVGGIWPGNGKSLKSQFSMTLPDGNFLNYQVELRQPILLPILYQSLTFPLFSDPARTTAPATEEGLVAARSCSPLAGPWWDFSRTIPRRVSTTTDWRWFSLYLVDSPLQPIFQTSCDTKHPMYPMLGSTRTIKRDLELLKPCQDKHSDDEGASDLWIILFFCLRQARKSDGSKPHFPDKHMAIKFGRIFQSETNPCWISWGVEECGTSWKGSSP